METPREIQGRPLVAQIEAWELSLRLEGCQHRIQMQCWVLKTHHATVAATSPAVGWPVPLKFDAKRMRAVSASELAHACSRSLMQG